MATEASAGAGGRGEAEERWGWVRRLGLSPARLADPAFAELYPFAPRRHDLGGGRTLSYLDEGRGEPVVMLHGNPTWSFFYRNLVLALRGRWRCLVPDHLGCGLSDKPADHPYSLSDHVANLESWLEAALPPAARPEGRFNLVVHDWGGPIGFGYAVRHPERILRLAVMNTSIFTEGRLPLLRIRAFRAPLLGALLARGLNLFAGGAARLTTVRPLSRKVRDGFLLPYNSWRNRVGVHAFVKDIPLAGGSPSRALLSRIGEEAPEKLADKPLLIQWGMRDWCFTPFFLDLWRRRFPGAELDRLPAGHYLLEDAGPAVADNLRRFLEGPLP